MNKEVVKITLEGYGESMTVEFSERELGFLVKYFWDTDKLTVVTSPDIRFPYANTHIEVKKSFQEYGDLLPISQLGNFESNVEPGSSGVFILELIMMDEDEFEKLPEFMGW